MPQSVRLDDTEASQQAQAIYFSAPDCGVCQVLQPSIQQLLSAEFPRIAWCTIDCAATPVLAAEYGIFSVPALIVWFDGQEVLRLVRHFSAAQLREQLLRPYALFFE